MRRLPIVIVALLLAGGCDSLKQLASSAPKPTAEIKATRLGNIDLNAATLDFDVEVSNPYDVALPITNLAYTLGSDGTALLAGRTANPAPVPARGRAQTTLTATVQFADVLATLRNVRPGSVVPYEATVEVGMDAPGIGPLVLPLKRRGELPVPAVPSVSLERVAWEELTMRRAAATLHVRVRNDNSFPVDVSALDYAVALAGRDVAAARINRPVSLGAGGGEQVLEIPISLAPQELGLAALSLFGGAGGGYDLAGTMQLDTRFGAMNLPFRRSGETRFTR